MENYTVYLDAETTSGDQIHADIVSYTGLLVRDKDSKTVEEFTYFSRPRISRCYQVDAYLVNGFSPYETEKHEYSNHRLAKKLNETFTRWKNKGHLKFNAFAGYNFDFLLTSQTWFSNLYSFPWLFSTNASQMDTLPIARNMEYYRPEILKTELNKKSNKVFKLSSLCNLNGFPIAKAHTSYDDTVGLKNLTEYLKSKDPELFKKSLQFLNKKDVLPYIKNLKYFYTTETFFSRTRQFACCYLTEHSIYQGYLLNFDLKHDPKEIFSIKSNKELSKILFATPVKMRTIKPNRLPLILKPDDKWVTNMEDEYSLIGKEVLEERADYISKNRSEIASRIDVIIKDKFEENNIDQTKLLPEQKIFALRPNREKQNYMNSFVISNNMDEKRKIAENFEDNEDLKHLSELILLDEYGEEAFTEKDYKRIRKGISQRLLSTNNEPYPTIPAQFLRVDEIRVQEKDDKERLKKVEIINEHLEKMSNDHEKYL
tara:strand:- start:166 stop:1620 length:1455 start_codon:yes stop_codon:yes gene_type:complete